MQNLIPTVWPQLQPWEKCLPKCYVIATTLGPKSLTVKVEIQTTDTAEIKSGPALVAVQPLVNSWMGDYVECNQLSTQKLQHAIPVFNVDGTHCEAGLTTETIDTILQSDRHMEHMSFVGCIYAPYKVNPNIFQFYFYFPDIFYHTSMHLLFRNIYEFYLIFYDFISSFIIYNNHLYLRQHFLFDSIWCQIC